VSGRQGLGIFKENFSLKNSTTYRDAYITQDSAKAIQQERRTLIKAMKKARALGLNSKVIDRHLIVGEEKFTCGTIPEHLGPVHTYTDIFESATFSLRIRLPSTRIRRIRQRIRKKINTLSKVEKNISATNPLTCGRMNPDIFLSDDVKSVSSLLPNNREF